MQPGFTVGLNCGFKPFVVASFVIDELLIMNLSDCTIKTNFGRGIASYIFTFRLWTTP